MTDPATTARDRRGDNLAAAIERHEPWDAWQNADDRHYWALVTTTGNLRWLRTFANRPEVDVHVRDNLQDSECLTALVDLDTGTEHVPVLTWVPNECTWPTCSNPPALHGRQFLGGALCTTHTDETYERDAAARDEIEAARADRG